MQYFSFNQIIIAVFLAVSYQINQKLLSTKSQMIERVEKKNKQKEEKEERGEEDEWQKKKIERL